MKDSLIQTKESLSRLREKSGFDRLSQRERWVLLGGIVFVFSFIIFQFVLTPYFEAKDNIAKSIAKKEQDLAKIMMLREEYLQLKADEGSVQSRLDKRDTTFTLFTFLDTQAGKAGVKKQIQYMKPSIIEGDDSFDEAIVELKLEKIQLSSLVEFLLLIESKDNVVFVKRMSIQDSGGGGGTLDSILQLATFTRKEQS